MKKINISKEKTPLLKFLLWSSPDATEVSEEEARCLYLKGEDYQKIIPPTDYEKKLIMELVYGKKET